MPVAFWIAHVEVTDEAAYALYAKGATEAIQSNSAGGYSGRAPA